jgi:CubicO group peptidase (beta-lactamase class C family)
MSVATAWAQQPGAAARAADRPAAPPARAALQRVVDSLANDAVNTGKAVSISVALLRGGDTIVAKGYGFADAERKRPATPRTVYRIGSVTKQFTAAAIQRLAEQGKLSVDDEITKYLPDYPVQGHRVTIRHLLNHTSGVKTYTALPEWQKRMGEELPLDTVVGFFASLPFDFAPGERYAYNNSGYFLLGRIIERVSGRPYAEYLRREIFARAGLKETRYCPSVPQPPNDAEGYATATPLTRSTAIGMTSPYAAGALCSTVMDLVRWERALSGGRVVSAASYQAMTTPGRLNDGEPLRYGYGLTIGLLGGRRMVAHGGAINGFMSHLAAIPSDSLTVAVLVNTEGPIAGQLADRVLRAALGLPLVEPPKDLPLTAEERSRYVGTFALELPNSATLQLRVFEEGEQLTAQAVGPGQGPFRLMAQGNHAFVASVDPAIRLTFTVEGARATRVVLLQGGARMAGARVE